MSKPTESPPLKTEEELSYFISEKGPFCVISFFGPLTRGASQALERCETEVTEKSSATVSNYVLCLKDVKGADYVGIGALVRLQKRIRHHGGVLRVCLLPPDLEKIMSERGAIRGDEFALDLMTALQSFPKPKAA